MSSPAREAAVSEVPAPAQPAPEPAAAPALVVGNTFLHPAFDYLLIGGGLSLMVTLAVGRLPHVDPLLALSLPVALFVFNLAHFAASTVRLYTKPGAFTALPFLTMGFPLVALAVLTVAIASPQAVGMHLQALYLTWSPYHYAAQAYGLAVMYCYRSGCALGLGEKRLLRLTALLPFAFAFMSGRGGGIEWFVPGAVFVEHPVLHTLRGWTLAVLGTAAFAAPAALFYLLGTRRRRVPLISLLLVVTNAVWWIVLDYNQAFVWATVFHSLQYLAITLVFHVREQTGRPGNRHGWLFHALRFQALCLALGYVLFQLLPLGYHAAGFGWASSIMLVVAAINVHHFVVDAYIWRLRKDPNYRIVMAAA